MTTLANAVTVTSALKLSIESVLEIDRSEYYTYSDPRKVKGFSKAVGVKICNKYFSTSQIEALVAEMVGKGYIFIRATVTKYPSGTGWRKTGGTRLTFAQPNKVTQTADLAASLGTIKVVIKPARPRRRLRKSMQDQYCPNLGF